MPSAIPPEDSATLLTIHMLKLISSLADPSEPQGMMRYGVIPAGSVDHALQTKGAEKSIL